MNTTIPTSTELSNMSVTELWFLYDDVINDQLYIILHEQHKVLTPDETAKMTVSRILRNIYEKELDRRGWTRDWN
jgi:preprotein translocase subunit SecA